MNDFLMVAVSASMIDQFNMNNICILQKLGYHVVVACNFYEGNTTSDERIAEFKSILTQMGVTYYNLPVPKNILNLKSIIESIQILKEIFRSNSFYGVHCHSPVGSVVCRIAGRKARKAGTKIIYTAHGFHFFKGAPVINWLLFYPIERLFVPLTDILITINREDYNRAQKMKYKQIYYIPGVGINTSYFQNKSNCFSYRKKIGIDEKSLVFLSVGELNKNKNHITIIRAIAGMDRRDFIYLICGKGKWEPKLHKEIVKYGLENNIFLLGFQKDIKSLLALADIYVFPSYREGLSVAMLEAMASGLPIVASEIRGNVELVEEEKGGYLVKPNDINGFKEKIELLMGSEELRNRYGQYNLKKIKNFDQIEVNEKMHYIYSNL